VLVAPDHTVFAGTGEASSYNLPDPSAFGAQDIDSPRKIFHIDANGNGLVEPVLERRPERGAAGVRLRFGTRSLSIQPGTGVDGVPVTLYIGDVG
jgi:hypothetical protein